MPENLLALIKGDRYGLNKAAYLSWTDDGRGYFIKIRQSSAWELDVPDEFPLQINELRARFKDFDLGLKAIVFGHEGTHIYAFDNLFVAHLRGNAKESGHPLRKVSS